MRAAKIDANQPEIVSAMRKAGASVQHLHSVGQGCPDLLCAVAGRAFLVEIKDGSKPASKQKLTPDQIEWHSGWKSQVHIVNSVDAALGVVAMYRTGASQEKQEN